MKRTTHRPRRLLGVAAALLALAAPAAVSVPAAAEPVDKLPHAANRGGEGKYR